MKSLVMSLALILSAQAAWGSIYFGAETAAEKKNEYCFYTNTVPQLLAGPGSSPAQVQLVSDLNAKWSAGIEASKKEFVTNTSEKESCSELSFSYQETSGFDVKTALNAKIVSIVFWTSMYTGGAHGGFGQSAETFNTETGEVYANLATFVDNSHLKAIKDGIRASLSNADQEFDFSYGFDEWEKSITDISQLDRFYITPQGITFFFSEYEVAPYSAGLIEAQLYWYEVAPLLKKTGPATLIPTNE